MSDVSSDAPDTDSAVLDALRALVAEAETGNLPVLALVAIRGDESILTHLVVDESGRGNAYVLAGGLACLQSQVVGVLRRSTEDE